MATATIPDAKKKLPPQRGQEPRRLPPPPTTRSWRLGLARIGVALLAGALHGAGWLFPGAWYAVWAGQIALVFVGFICPPRAAFFHGMLAGAVGIGCGFYWGIDSLGDTIDASKTVAIVVFGVLVAIESIAFGLFCGIVSVAGQNGPRRFWLVPCAWVAIEFWFPRLFPWKIGYSQLEWIALLQIAELLGSVGIGFVMTAVAAIPTLIVMALRSARASRDRQLAIGYSVAAGLILAVSLAFGNVRQRQWTAWAEKQSKLRVALIQVDPAYVGSEDELRQRSLAVHDQVDLICWPESALGTYSEELTHFRDVEQTLERSLDSQNSLQPAHGFRCHLLAGGKIYRDGATEEGPFAMAALLIGPTQDILGTYRKRTLLPLGEYVPLQSFFPSIRHWMTIRDVIEAGNDADPLHTSEGSRLGVLICYEDMIERNVRQTAAAGAEALFSLIQGSAFENPLTLIQHQRLAALRAVENRRYFVRCSSTGVTCVISPIGQIVAQLPPQSDGTLLSEIALIRGRTLYNLAGDLFPAFCTILVAAGLLRYRRDKFRGSSRSPRL